MEDGGCCRLVTELLEGGPPKLILLLILGLLAVAKEGWFVFVFCCSGATIAIRVPSTDRRLNHYHLGSLAQTQPLPARINLGVATWRNLKRRARNGDERRTGYGIFAGHGIEAGAMERRDSGLVSVSCISIQLINFNHSPLNRCRRSERRYYC